MKEAGPSIITTVLQLQKRHNEMWGDKFCFGLRTLYFEHILLKARIVLRLHDEYLHPKSHSIHMASSRAILKVDTEKHS